MASWTIALTFMMKVRDGSRLTFALIEIFLTPLARFARRETLVSEHGESWKMSTGDMAWAVSEAQRGGGRNRGDIQNWCHIGIKITYIDTMHESWQRLASYTSHHHISSSATRRVRRHDKWWRKVLVMSPATRMLRKHETLKYTRCVAKSVATKEPCRPCCKLYISHERCDVIHSK